MAKRITIKNALKNQNRGRVSNVQLPSVDSSEEAIKEREAHRNSFPDPPWENVYQTIHRGKASFTTIDFSTLAKEYPFYQPLLKQIIVGVNLYLTPGYSEKRVKRVFPCIREFMEFLNSSSNYSNVQICTIADINITVAQAFSNYLVTNYPQRPSNRDRYGTIKRCIEKLKNQYSDDDTIGRPFKWPIGPNRLENNKQGYKPNQMKDLIRACILDIKEIKKFHQRYENVSEELYIEEWNLENLMYWLYNKNRFRYTNTKKFVAYAIKSGVRENTKKKLDNFLEDGGYSIEQIATLLDEEGEELAMAGRSPFATHTRMLSRGEKADALFDKGLATMKKHFPQYPFSMGYEDVRDFINHMQPTLLHGPLHEITRRAIINSASKISFLNGSLGIYGVHAAMHFTNITLYPFLLLCIINTGWNLESILSLSDDVDAHVTKDLIDPDNYVLIHSIKRRGAADHESPNSTIHRSNIKKQFGTYQLLKYVESVIKKYRSSPHYKHGFLWQFITSYHEKINKLISDLGETESLFKTASTTFVSRHKFKTVREKRIDHARVRSGYVAMREIQGLSEFEIAEDLDHSQNTNEGFGSINHYISDESSNIVKDIKIKEIQSQFIMDLTNFKQRIIESKTLQELRKAIKDSKNQSESNEKIKEISKELNLEEKTIVNLLTPEAQKYIVVCEDSSRPTWPGHERFVRPGSRCKYFNKCVLCERAVIFPEALPFIARRILDLEAEKNYLSSAEWILKYGDEYDAWKQVLECWSNKKQVEKAWEEAEANLVVLPRVMRGV